jgi:DHA2 family multidrug resistance protein
MCPATIAPALQGWITDTVSWSWIFALNLPAGFAGLFIVCRAVNGHGSPEKPAVRFDIIGLMLLGCSIACLVYVLQEGSRYDWFEEPKILYLTFAGSVTLILLIIWEMWSQNQGALIDSRVFRDPHFTFGFIVSFVAGFALFGSAFIIPLFATNVLDLSPTHSGLLLLPSGALIGFGHLLAGGLIQIKRVPPFKFIPIGVICLMTGMWLLSGSTVDSGAPDMSGALLLRGFGLGLMFVALTMVTLGDLSGSCINHGVGLFNFGRQMGGLIGIAFLQTYLDRQIALNRGVLAQYLTPDAKALSERQDMIIGLLGERGYDAADVASAAIAMLQKSLQTQVAVLSFNEAFLAIALLFVFAAPVLIAIQILQKLTGGRTHAH